MTGPRVPRLSICIVSWNTRSLLAECLQSLLADPESAEWEIRVVDNASTDGSADMVEASFPTVQLLRSPRNLGFAAANNRAMRDATAPLLLLLNSDTRVPRKALGSMVRYLEDHPGVGAVGPRLVDGNGALQMSCGRSPTLASEIVNKLLLHKLFPFFKFGRWDHADTRVVGWVTGACIMVRRQAVEDAGPLDPGIFMFFEDLEWCMRIRDAGWPIVYFPHSEIVHLGGCSVRQDFGRMLVISQRSLFYLFRKHYGSGTLHVLRLLTVMEMVLRSAVWLGGRVLWTRRREEAVARLRAYREILRRTLADRSYWAPQTDGQARDHT